jgi:hypothetical protein
MLQTVGKETTLKEGKTEKPVKYLTEEHSVNNRLLQYEKRRNVDFYEPRTVSVIFVLYG